MTKMFDEKSFNIDLKSKLHSIKNLDSSSFEVTFINVLIAHALIKTKILKANNHEFMTKTLPKSNSDKITLKMSI